MANYNYTNIAGTSRRRAKTIIINNPAQPLDGGNAQSIPTVTFEMEDRIIMSDGAEIFIDAGHMVVDINEDTLAKLYPSIDVETGEVDNSVRRRGSTIVSSVMDDLEDVFITEGIARDNIDEQAPYNFGKNG